MFNNDAINVFIGLILVFLLYSLLASILMEAFAARLGLRSRMLVKAVSKILDDGEMKTGSYFSRFFSSITETKYFDMYENRAFTALFYSHPNVVNLGRNSFSSKPTYISDELFADTVIQILRGDQFKGSENQVELIRTNIRDGQLPVPSYYGDTDYRLIKDEKPAEDKKFITLHKHTGYQLKQSLFDSHNDIDWFKNKLKLWFNETVERSQG